MLLRIFARLHGGVRISVGWVERSETHHAMRRPLMGFARALPILRAGPLDAEVYERTARNYHELSFGLINITLFQHSVPDAALIARIAV